MASPSPESSNPKTTVSLGPYCPPRICTTMSSPGACAFKPRTALRARSNVANGPSSPCGSANFPDRVSESLAATKTSAAGETPPARTRPTNKLITSFMSAFGLNLSADRSNTSFALSGTTLWQARLRPSQVFPPRSRLRQKVGIGMDGMAKVRTVLRDSFFVSCFVPEGHSKIARCFNAGKNTTRDSSRRDG